MAHDIDENLRETRMSDRNLILHLLQHVEELAPLAELVELLPTLRRLRPLLDQLAPNGQAPDAIGAAQVWRAGRRLRAGAHRGVPGGR